VEGGPVTLPAQLLSVGPQLSAAGVGAEKVQAAGRVTGPLHEPPSHSVVPYGPISSERNHGTFELKEALVSGVLKWLLFGGVGVPLAPGVLFLAQTTQRETAT